MFSDLPKLLDRNFAVGYALPATFFLLFALEMLRLFGVYALPPALTQSDPLVGTLLISLVAWAVGITLSGLNRNIYRIFEGYGGRLNPFHYVKFLQVRRLATLEKQIAETKALAIKNGAGSSAHVKLARLMTRRSKYFPDTAEWLLPTTFGNVIRSFEVYSRVMYGYEAIDGWSRILAVVPTDYRELITDAKTQTDLWLNIQVLSLALFILYGVLVLQTAMLQSPWMPLFYIILAYIASNRATNAALVWGEMVKATFDTFLPDLAKKFGSEAPLGSEEQYKFWTSFSQAIIYTNRASLRDLPQIAQKESGESLPKR